jgi:hypothetical protein
MRGLYDKYGLDEGTRTFTGMPGRREGGREGGREEGRRGGREGGREGGRIWEGRRSY